MLEDKSELWKWCKSKTGNVRDLAKAIHVTPTFVSFMINGKKPVPPELIRDISAYTGIPAKDLRPDLWSIFNE